MNINKLNRRKFLGNSTLAGATVLAGSAFAQDTAGGSKKLKFVIIGCGGRGTGAVKNFLEACEIVGAQGELVAAADAFSAKAEALGKKYGLDAKKCYGGFDAYQKAIAEDCDYVLMATPPNFRPVHFAAAVEAGKHCFIEKPVAVDPVGCRSIIATGEKAKAKGLAVVCGTQRRHTGSYLKNKALIENGAIGEIKGGVVQWNGRVPWVRNRETGQSDADYLANNWLNFVELSGDHIVEQHVHNLDVAIWFLGRLPTTAVGFGGRARRTSGNSFDFFSVDYDFGEDVHIHSQCRQIAGCYNRVGEMFTGTHGVCLGGGKLTGKEVSIPEIKVDTKNGQCQEHVDMIRSVIAGKPLNEAQQIAESTAVAIMGRIACFTGKLVTLRDLLEREGSDYYNLACTPAAIDFEKGEVKAPEEVAVIPGEPDPRFS